MALTIGTTYAADIAKPSPQQSHLGTKLVFATVTFDSSYASGGYAIAASDLGLDEILSVGAFANGGYVPEWDGANSKLKAMYADYDAAGDGVLIEAPSSGSLGSISCFIMAVGR